MTFGRSPRPRRWSNSSRTSSALGGKVLDQTRRRVLDGESVPNDEKLFSLFEPHTELLKRGKAGKDIEFGHMIQIQQVDEKFITAYEVFDQKPVEHTLLDPALAQHRKLFGFDPWNSPPTRATTRAWISSVNSRRRSTSSPSRRRESGRRPSPSESRSPLSPRTAFRAGVEGTISFLKRMLRLARCFNKSWEHYVATIGQTIFAHNLLILARP